MIEKEINEFLETYDYDIRKTGNARWIDQKCTPDILNVIADCVVNFAEDNGEILFNSRDIWDLEYSSQLIKIYFNKPHPLDKKASNEYDKFFAQPLELLAYSGVLAKQKKGNRNYYRINNLEILKFISLNDKNAFVFLVNYINHVLNDSNILKIFDAFFEYQNDSMFKFLKSEFLKFIISNTKINTSIEVSRIFSKVLNPLACYYKKCGTSHGRKSKDIIYYSDLLYNQLNFRDIYSKKPKGVTRSEWRSQQENQPDYRIFNHKSNKAVDFLHSFNDKYRNGWSEVLDEHADLGTHMHHIFPKSKFPEISYYYENIIALSPTQHLNYAHPNGNTQYIDLDYQIFILKEKTKRINENILNSDVETIYSFDKLIEVINEGFDKDYDLNDNDFERILDIINECSSEKK